MIYVYCFSVEVYNGSFDAVVVLYHCWLGGRKGIRPVKN